jgi:aminoglycoside phosphotransferase (APT) family kinase protein
MSVEREFTEDNFMRATRHVTTAKVLAHILAAELCRACPTLWTKPPHITALASQGWSNFTLRIDSDERPDSYILRLSERRHRTGTSDSRSNPQFEKERHVLRRLRARDWAPKLIEPASGVLHLEVPGRGEVSYAFMLQSCIPFESATQLRDTECRERILERLASVAREIHKTPTSGYGTDLDESSGSFSYSSLSTFINSNITRLEASPIDSSMKRWLTARLDELCELDTPPRLFHRDLLGNWGNFLVDKESNIRGIIDWEFAGSGPAFHYEIASLLYVLQRDGHSPDAITRDLHAVLRGYEMPLSTYKRDHERYVETIVLMNSISALIKFADLQRCGATSREPWRKRFAERATELCSSCYSRDCMHLSPETVTRRLVA